MASIPMRAMLCEHLNSRCISQRNEAVNVPSSRVSKMTWDSNRLVEPLQFIKKIERTLPALPAAIEAKLPTSRSAH